MKYKGFTLSELLLALVIIGIIAALVLPAVNNNMPSRNKMMMKKAYYTITDVVSELINNEQYYPEIGSDGNTYVGFDNTLNACGEKPADSTEGEVDGSGHLDSSCQGLYKFPKLFAKQLNISEDLSDIGSSDYLSNINAYQKEHEGETIPRILKHIFEMNARLRGISFATSDGMIWIIEGIDATTSGQPLEDDPIRVISNATGASGIINIITVDVNGSRNPNCYQGADGGCASKTKDFDQFVLYVTERGKIIPKSGQTWFENAIGIDSTFSGD